MLIDPQWAQPASSDAVRAINRRLVLNLIRTGQPASRADLARISGLQRSTISLIVEELIEQHWVIEGATGRLPRGRHPTFLQLNHERGIVGIDIRPIQTTVAMSDVNGKFAPSEVFATPPDPDRAVEALIERILPIIASRPENSIEGIGISVPGRFNRALGRLAFAPNLRWGDFDLRTPISRATGLAVEVENAANACALAAVWFDRMDSCRNLVVVSVSEGIGTGIWVNGQLARGLNDMAGEFGHVTLDPAGPVCNCGNRGCWEVFASNRAALASYGEPDLAFQTLLERVEAGDLRAAAALESQARYLGRGMRAIAASLAPERIIVVGDITRCFQRYAPLIEAELAAQILPGARPPLLLAAHEGGLARLRGTVALVLQKDFGA